VNPVKANARRPVGTGVGAASGTGLRAGQSYDEHIEESRLAQRSPCRLRLQRRRIPETDTSSLIHRRPEVHRDDVSCASVQPE
jgi:hypothetical protein